MVESHSCNPLHVIEEWGEQGFWERTSLEALGLVYNLGHGGARCVSSEKTPQEMVVVHDFGIHKMRIRYCNCGIEMGKAVPEPLQLIGYGFWPGSWKSPKTIFTLQLLQRFCLLTHQASANAQDFVDVLQRMTDGVEPSSTKVSPVVGGGGGRYSTSFQDRAREFRMAVREYQFVRDLKRGRAQADQLGRGSLAVSCPACPHPEINMKPGWRNARANEK